MGLIKWLINPTQIDLQKVASASMFQIFPNVLSKHFWSPGESQILIRIIPPYREKLMKIQMERNEKNGWRGLVVKRSKGG